MSIKSSLFCAIVLVPSFASFALAALVPAPKISASPATINLGNIKAGSISPTASVTIKNNGRGDLVVGSLTITGVNAAEFSQSGTCGTIVAGGTCSLNVTFSPVLPFGKKSALLQIPSNDPKKSLLSVKLSGAAPAPSMTASPSSLNFGKVTEGSAKVTKTVTIGNRGLSDLEISSVEVSGSNYSEFSAVSACSTVKTGETCTIDVSFEAASPDGKKIAELVISSNYPNKPVVIVRLAGQGPVAPPRSKLIGSWYMPYPKAGKAKGPVIITFIDDANFMMAHDGSVADDPSGQPGIERGTYTWDKDTGALVATVLVDTNGQWGFSHPAPGESINFKVSADGNSLLSAGVPFAIKINKSGANPLIGSWYMPYPDAGQALGPVVITFIDNTSYMMAHDGSIVADPSGQPGIERGTYTWDKISGAFAATVLVDTNGEWGFSHPGAGESLNFKVSADGNSLLSGGTEIATRVQ